MFGFWEIEFAGGLTSDRLSVNVHGVMEIKVLAPSPVVLVVLLLLLVASFGSYACERKSSSGRGKMVALIVRLIAVALLFILASPTKLVRNVSRKVVPEVVMLFDVSRSMAVNTGGVESGWEEIKRTALSSWTSLLDRLKKVGRVRVLAFGDDLRTVSVGQLALMNPSASRSRLSAAIRKIESDSRGPVSLVLFSDGHYSNPEAVLQTGRDLNSVRVFAVGVGTRGVPSDTRVTLSPEDSVVFPNTVASLTATVTLRKGAVFEGWVTLFEGMRRIDRQRVKLSALHPRESLAFEVEPKNKGQSIYRVECTLAEGELVTSDNEDVAVVRVTEDKPRVLYIENRARWEYKFIKRVWEKGGDIALLALVNRANLGFYVQGELVEGNGGVLLRLDREFLEDFDLVALGDLPAKSFTSMELEQLRWYVEDHGGGLLLLGGQQALGSGGYAGTPVAEVMPVRLAGTDSVLDMPFRPLLTVEGRESRFLQTLFTRTGENELTLDACNVVGPGKPGASVLLRCPSTGRPLLSWQRYGKGRAAVFAADSTWRWVFEAAKRKEMPDLHRIFWQGIVHLVTNADRGRSLSLMSDKDEVFEGESVAFRVNRLDASGWEAKAINLSAVSSEGIKVVGHATKIDRRAADLIGRLTFDKSGAYVVTATVANAHDVAESNTLVVRVTPDETEFRYCGLNEEYLRELCNVTGGQYVRAEDTSRLPELVMRESTNVTERQEVSVAEMTWPYPILAALLCIEWLLRRKQGLA